VLEFSFLLEENKMKKILILIFILIFGLSLISSIKEKGFIVESEDKLPSLLFKKDFKEEKEVRVLAEVISKEDKEKFVLKGCKIKHNLKDKTAFSCPIEIVDTLDVREDKKYYPISFKSDLQINADDVWSWGYDGSGITIAILDTGVDDAHIELSDNIILTKNFVGGSSEDTNGHGTHISGIITGNGFYNINNNSVKGVSPNANIIVGKVCGTKFCYDSDIEAGIEWAVNNSVDIISLSLGGSSYTGYCDGDYLANKSNWAVDQGVLVIAASGNGNSGVVSPACGTKVISVGAVDENDVRASWSNYGEILDFVAPGVSILSTDSCHVPGRSCQYHYYSYKSGTSMAVPHVVGMSALILQANPFLTPLQVKEILIDTAIDLGDLGKDDYYGYGRIDGANIIDVEGNLVPEFGFFVGALAILSGVGIFFFVRRK
jgi:subtilisin family serine protease